MDIGAEGRRAEHHGRMLCEASASSAARASARSLCNSLNYGDALGPAGRSVQLPLLIYEARESGTAHTIGRDLSLVDVAPYGRQGPLPQ